MPQWRDGSTMGGDGSARGDAGFSATSRPQAIADADERIARARCKQNKRRCQTRRVVFTPPPPRISTAGGTIPFGDARNLLCAMNLVFERERPTIALNHNREMSLGFRP